LRTTCRVNQPRSEDRRRRTSRRSIDAPSIGGHIANLMFAILSKEDQTFVYSIALIEHMNPELSPEALLCQAELEYLKERQQTASAHDGVGLRSFDGNVSSS